MIALLAALVPVAEAVFGARAVARTAAYLRSSAAGGVARQQSKTGAEDPRLVIVVPCLDEQKRIGPTLEALFREFPAERCEIVVATVDEVEHNKGAEVLTSDVVRTTSEAACRHVIVADMPGDETRMAWQLNYAIKELERLGVGWDYLCLYNADSRPLPGTYEAALGGMRRRAPVMQQYSCMTANYSSLGPLMRGFALYQTNYELKTGLLGTALPTPLTLPHVVGHGLFVRHDVLDTLGGFNEEQWCEDIFMTQQLAASAERPEALGALELAAAPRNFRAQIVQYSTWAKTAMRAALPGAKAGSGPRAALYAANRLVRTLAWLLSPAVIVASGAVCAVEWAWPGVAASVFAYLGMCWAEYGSTALLAKRCTGDAVRFGWPVVVLLTPVVRLLSCLGPLCSLFEDEKKRTPVE